MILQLIIKHYALIEHIDIKFDLGLNVITGETGAGKSIMLGALGLLMGNRVNSKMLWRDNKKCVIEGIFNIASYDTRDLFERLDIDYEEITTVRREINTSGKSRGFINDSPVTIDTMQQMSRQIMDVHVQHENTQIKTSSKQLQMIDLYAGSASKKKNYQEAWRYFMALKERHQLLEHESLSLRQEMDYVKHQLDELSTIDLTKISLEQLQEDYRMMENAEEIKRTLRKMMQLIDEEEKGVYTTLSHMQNQIASLESYAKDYRVLATRLESMRKEIKDITEELFHKEGQITYDEVEVEKVRTQLDFVQHLLHKHQRQSVDELLELQSILQDKIDKHATLDADLEKARKEEKLAVQRLEQAAQQLSRYRRDVFESFCDNIVCNLKKLGMPYARLSVYHKHVLPNASGIDDIQLFFSANKGVELQSMATVASGGEFSRLVFCIRYALAVKAVLPTLILDEIDSGISGEVAVLLGNMMGKMKQQCQLLIITHLPQIAAKADEHFHVYKTTTTDSTISKGKALNQEQRIAEIARMISGQNPSPVALANAKELIDRET